MLVLKNSNISVGQIKCIYFWFNFCELGTLLVEYVSLYSVVMQMTKWRRNVTFFRRAMAICLALMSGRLGVTVCSLILGFMLDYACTAALCLLSGIVLGECHVYFNVLSRVFQCAVTCISMCFHVYFNALLRVFQCVVTCISMCCHVYFNVFSRVFQCVVTCISVCCYVYFNVLSNVFQCVVTCISVCCYVYFNVLSRVFQCVFTCISMRCYVYFNVFSRVFQCVVTCISMCCYVYFNALHVYFNALLRVFQCVVTCISMCCYVYFNAFSRVFQCVVLRFTLSCLHSQLPVGSYLYFLCLNSCIDFEKSKINVEILLCQMPSDIWNSILFIFTLNKQYSFCRKDPNVLPAWPSD
jgi:uncharacterized integral membrane protein